MILLKITRCLTQDAQLNVTEYVTEEYVFKRDDMFDSTDYLLNLDKTIVETFKNPEPILLELVTSFTNYLDYMSEKITMKSEKEMHVCEALWKQISNEPSFFQSEIRLDEVKGKCSWSEDQVDIFRKALDNLQKSWVRFTGICIGSLKLYVS